MNGMNRRTMIGGATALGATAAVGIPVSAALRPDVTIPKILMRSYYPDPDNPLIAHAVAIDIFLDGARRHGIDLAVRQVKACNCNLRHNIGRLLPDPGKRLDYEIRAAADSIPGFGTIGLMELAIDGGSAPESGIPTVLLFYDDGRPGNRTLEMHGMAKGKSSMHVRSPESRKQWGISGTLCTHPANDGEAAVNATIKSFAAFLHHLHGEPDWIPDWVNSGEYQPEFAARIVNDRRRSTWIA